MATVQSQIDRVIWGGWRCVGGVLGESVEEITRDFTDT